MAHFQMKLHKICMVFIRQQTLENNLFKQIKILCFYKI